MFNDLKEAFNNRKFGFSKEIYLSIEVDKSIVFNAFMSTFYENVFKGDTLLIQSLLASLKYVKHVRYLEEPCLGRVNAIEDMCAIFKDHIHMK